MESVQLVGGDYEHTLGLGGRYGAIDISYTTAPLSAAFMTMIRERSYESCEFSLANYLMLKDRGEDWLHALPIFPYRAFRHSTMYVRADSALKAPSDLRGKRIGVPDFSMTAAVWTRGILNEHHGFDWRSANWVVSSPQRFSELASVDLDWIDGDLEAALIDGRIDALLTTRTNDEQKHPSGRKLRHLIPDVHRCEREYFEQTGIYPINHLVVVRSDVLRRAPAVPRAFFEAYTSAKNAAFDRRLGATLVPWGASRWRETFDLFSQDPLPYGLVEQNLRTLRVFGRYLCEQGLIGREPDLASLFVSG